MIYRAFATTLTFAAASAQAQTVTELDPGSLAGAFHIYDPARADLQIELLIQAGEGDHDGIEGLPHYLEHLVWLSVAEDFPLAKTSGSNAYTSQWATGYELTVPAENFYVGLATLMAVFDTPALDPTFMDEEIGIILQEYEARLDGSDVEQIYEDSRRWLYTLGNDELPQGLARTIIGEPEDIERFTVEQALALHEETHVPSRGVLIIRGPADPDVLAETLARRVGTGGGFEQVPKPDFITPALTSQRFATVDDRGDGARFAYRKLIDLETELSALQIEEAANLLRLILGGTRDESLQVPLYYDEFWVAGLTVSIAAVDEDTLALLIAAEPEPGVALEALEPRILAALSAAANRGISQDTLDRTRDLFLRERSAQTPVQAASRYVNSGLFNRQPLVDWETRNAALAEITTNDLETLLSALAGPGREAFVEIHAAEETAQ